MTLNDQSFTRGPSPHLTWDELACHDPDRTPYPTEWRETRAVVLAACFEAIRTVVGAPIRIGSGYRTLKWNRKVGGAVRSQHVEGRALDLYPPGDMTPKQLREIVYAIAKYELADIKGIGLYQTFVHFDIRLNKRLVLWEGKRAWAEVIPADTPRVEM
jgi:hypothetical protein